jgi:hypothetical protein
MIPLFGSIPDPVNDQAFYVLKEEQVSPTQIRFSGRIGFGMTAEDYRKSCNEDGSEMIEMQIDTSYSTPYVPFDMRDIQFLFDSETNIVRLECFCRGTVYAKEACRIPRISMELPTAEEVLVKLRKKHQCTEVSEGVVEKVLKELEEYRDSSWDDSYLYFRCPRSKDGIAVARALQYMFGDRTIQIVYPLIYNV